MQPEAASPVLGLRPGGRVVGRALVPSSKSEAQRMLVCAALASGSTEIEGLPDGEDVRAAQAFRSGWPEGARVDAGESGTLARLATAAAAFCAPPGRKTEVSASGTLLRRASPALFAAIARGGAEVTFLGTRNGWPVRIVAAAPPAEVLLENPMSSQEVSALLVALAAQQGERLLHVQGLIPSVNYALMTALVLERRFGASVHTVPGGGFRVAGPLRAPPATIVLEPDASSAAVALAAACLSGGEVVVPGLDAKSIQGDIRVEQHLASFGCRAWIDREGLHATGAPERGVALDLEREPDLAPVLAAVAATAAIRAGATSRLAGLVTLRGKESDRIDVLARGLAAVGLSTRPGRDFLEIGPPARPPTGALLDPHRDHRMAFAFALLGLVVDGVDVQDPGCVAKSWPSFWRDLAALGARLQGASA